MIGIPFWKTRNDCSFDAKCIGHAQIEAIRAYQTAGAPIALPNWATAEEHANSEPPAVQRNQAPSSNYRALTGVVIRARCHMNSCGWFSIESSNLVAETPTKSLFALKEKTWESEYPDGNYEQSRPRTFIGETASYIICSRKSPAIIDGNDKDGWTVAGLAPGARKSVYGYLETALAVYWAACHGMNVQDVYAATDLADKLGYPSTVAPDALEQRKLSNPTEAFDPR